MSAVSSNFRGLAFMGDDGGTARASRQDEGRGGRTRRVRQMTAWRARAKGLAFLADGSLRGSKGNVVRAATLETAAAPATVSGESAASHGHWGTLGRPATGDDPQARRPAVAKPCGCARAS